jgi:hypothetical protein
MAAAEVVEQDETPDFPDVRVDPRFKIQRDGKDFVLMSGLVDMLHQVSEGFFDVQTTLVQVPAAENDQTAIVTARVLVFERDALDVVKRCANGIGDASPANVTRMMAPHLIRMAETRAVARALRLLTNVGMTALEELGPSEPAERREEPRPTFPVRDASRDPAPPQVEGIVIEGRRFTRPQVEQAWRTRRAEAERLGIALPPQLREVVPERTPLPALTGHTQEVRRLCEATQAGQR